MAEKEAKRQVKIAVIAINFEIIGENSKKWENLKIRNIPAVTMVAECKSAETGVGPSIASGNQECNPN